MQDVGPGRASFVAYLIPPFALAYGVLLADEEVGPGALAGLVLILVGSWLATNRRSTAPAASAPE
jgi:drug/metabolite transporter (DMT)-like permease